MEATGRRANEGTWEKPLSSYGSMKSDSDDDDDVELGDAQTGSFCSDVLPKPNNQERTGLHMVRSDSHKTSYTTTSQQTKPAGAVVIDTRSVELDESSENDEELVKDVLFTSSPEAPEPFEPEDTNQDDDNSQPGTLHPEQDLPHIFKSIQSIVSRLTSEELCLFLMSLYQRKAGLTLKQAMEGDILDVVDRILQNFGQDNSLLFTIRTLENLKKPEAAELQTRCWRALIRSQLKEYFIRKYTFIHEGVVRAGKQRRLDDVYVEPQISVCGYGGVDSLLRPHPPSRLWASTFVGVNDLFGLQKDDGQLVRTVLTTGIPGIGLTVSVGKFSLDWAEQRSNKDLQVVIKLSFRDLWFLQSSGSDSQIMSIMEVIGFFYPECKGLKHLEEDCKFLIIMDSFDCYKAPLDWENAPVIKDNQTKAHTNVLIVNVIRGTLLRGARVWILGRRAAVSQIPSQYIDVVTEIQGFSDEMKDDYLTKRFHDEELGRKIVAHYKRLPMLGVLARQPFVCWMVATVFENLYRRQGYGVHPPRLTPFYIHILIVQTNRRLQRYSGREGHDLTWSSEDKQLLMNMGKMSLKMLERKTRVFFEADMGQYGLNLTQVVVFSGVCTEITADTDERRKFCFIHDSFQEFMAALYVFLMFRSEDKNVLSSGLLAKILKPKDPIKSAALLVRCAVERTQLGHCDMFLRFLCGLLSPQCHDKLLCGFFYRRDIPKISGLAEAQQVLKDKIEAARQKNGDRVENLRECLRELTQEDA